MKTFLGGLAAADLILLIGYLAGCGTGSQVDRLSCPEGQRWSWRDKICKDKKVPPIAIKTPVTP